MAAKMATNFTKNQENISFVSFINTSVCENKFKLLNSLFKLKIKHLITYFQNGDRIPKWPTFFSKIKD